MLIIIAGTFALLIYLVRTGSRHTYRPSIPDRWPDLPPAPPLDRSHVGDTQPPTSPSNHEPRTTPVPVPEFIAARIREGSFEGIRCPNCNQRDLTVEWIPFDEPLSTADGDISYELWCSACRWIALVQGPAFPSAPQAEEKALQNRNSEDSPMGTGGTPSGRTSLSLGSGAFQVYDVCIFDDGSEAERQWPQRGGHSHRGILQRSQLIWMNPSAMRIFAGTSRVEVLRTATASSRLTLRPELSSRYASDLRGNIRP